MRFSAVFNESAQLSHFQVHKRHNKNGDPVLKSEDKISFNFAFKNQPDKVLYSRVNLETSKFVPTTPRFKMSSIVIKMRIDHRRNSFTLSFLEPNPVINPCHVLKPHSSNAHWRRDEEIEDPSEHQVLNPKYAANSNPNIYFKR